MKKKKTLLIACLAVSISIPALSSTFGLYEPSWFSRKKKKGLSGRLVGTTHKSLKV